MNIETIKNIAADRGIEIETMFWVHLTNGASIKLTAPSLRKAMAEARVLGGCFVQEDCNGKKHFSRSDTGMPLCCWENSLATGVTSNNGSGPVFHPLPVEEEDVVDFCPDCGEEVGRWNWDYVSQNPNGSDMAREQAMLRHRAHSCSNSEEWDTILHCPHCGEELGRWDCEYASQYPNGLDMAMSQALEEHEECYCPVLWEQKWEDWRKETKANEGETPFALVNRLVREGQSLAIFRLPSPPDRNEDCWSEELANMKRGIEASLFG